MSKVKFYISGKKKPIEIKNVIRIDYKPYQLEGREGLVSFNKQLHNVVVYTEEVDFYFNYPVEEIILINEVKNE